MKCLQDMDEPTLRYYFNALAGAVEDILPAGPSAKGRCLFVLLVFDDPGLAQYVSNCERSTMVKALREAANRLESSEDVPR